MCAVDGGEESGELEALAFQVPHAAGLCLARGGVAVLAADVLQITGLSFFALSALGVPEALFSVVALPGARLRGTVFFAVDLLSSSVEVGVGVRVCVSTLGVTSSVGVDVSSVVGVLTGFRGFVFICGLTSVGGTPEASSFTARLGRQQCSAKVFRIMRVTFNALGLFRIPKTSHPFMGLIITGFWAQPTFTVGLGITPAHTEILNPIPTTKTCSIRAFLCR